MKENIPRVSYSGTYVIAWLVQAWKRHQNKYIKTWNSKLHQAFNEGNNTYAINNSWKLQKDFLYEIKYTSIAIIHSGQLDPYIPQRCPWKHKIFKYIKIWFHIYNLLISGKVGTYRIDTTAPDGRTKAHWSFINLLISEPYVRTTLQIKNVLFFFTFFNV